MSRVEILQMIETLREHLNVLGLKKPLVDPEVIQVSQRLDSLLNIYNSL
ncbi:aspartyl-phosphate phosphatase Spo0E family protein [Desulfosporosinus sp. FKB]|nr:aspartyl-phosphate phosphatase Spo0E family protein [Desulfosporosinus sp. FKB]